MKRHGKNLKCMLLKSQSEKATHCMIPTTWHSGNDETIVAVQLLSCVWLFSTLWGTARQASLPSPSSGAFPNSCPLSQWCHPAIASSCSLLLLPPVFPSISLFQWVCSSHQVTKVVELQLQHQSFQWIFRIDFFRIDWFDFFEVQGTLKSLLQFHSLKASILQHSVFFIVQLWRQKVSVARSWRQHWGGGWGMHRQSTEEF